MMSFHLLRQGPMGYLYIALTLAAWTTIAFVYKGADRASSNRLWLAAMFGLVVAVGNIALALYKGIDLTCSIQSQYIIGISLGVVSVGGLPAFMAAVQRGDLSITWTVMTLSFALASLLSIIYPGEHPTAWGIIGLLTAGAAVVLLGMDMHSRNKNPEQSKPRSGWGLYMALSFLTNTYSMYCYTLSDSFNPDKLPEGRTAFLLSYGLVLFVLSAVLAFMVKQQASVPAGIKWGLVGGMLIFAGSLFTILAKNDAGVLGSVLFPITTGGSNVLVVALSVLFLKERPGKYGWLGLGAGALAIVLLGTAA
jgi:drug/metabolite transporter (DMT)-like permease